MDKRVKRALELYYDGHFRFNCIRHLQGNKSLTPQFLWKKAWQVARTSG